jgi:WD40 repeat protein
LQAFDNEITRLDFLSDREWLISSSKNKSIKIWALPKEWRDAKLVADERKQAGKFIN